MTSNTHNSECLQLKRIISGNQVLNDLVKELCLGRDISYCVVHYADMFLKEGIETE